MEEGRYGQLDGESTVNWLRRLIGMGAPTDIRANVQTILAAEARAAAAATADAVLPMPTYEQAVFVLCDSIRRGGIPMGTCFAISPRFLLTCYHNLLESADGAPATEYSIALSVERDPITGRLLFNEGSQEARLRFRNKHSDWAILEVLGPDLAEVLPISLGVVLADTYVKIFHCLVAMFNEMSEDLLSVDTVWAKTLRGTAHHLRCNIGLYGRSSGAPVVLRNGCVVAFYRESAEARILPAGDELVQMDPGDVMDVISDTVNSVVGTHSSTAKAVEIRKCPRLVTTLRNIGVSI